MRRRKILDDLGMLFTGGLLATGGHEAVNLLLHRSGPTQEQSALVVASVATFAAMGATAFITWRLHEKMDAFASHITGPRFTYYSFDRPKEQELAFSAASDIVLKAENSICALNAWREESSEAPSQARENYFSAVMQRSQSVTYRRIVQIDPHTRLVNEFDRCYVEHFKAMATKAKTRQRGEPDISIQILDPLFPSTFVIVDDRYLLWQLNEVSKVTTNTAPSVHRKHFTMRGLVVVDDRGGDFVGHFVRVFNQAHSRATRSVAPEDLDGGPFTFAA